MKFYEEKRKKNVFAIRYGVQPPTAGRSQSAVTFPRRPYPSCAVPSWELTPRGMADLSHLRQ